MEPSDLLAQKLLSELQRIEVQVDLFPVPEPFGDPHLVFDEVLELLAGRFQLEPIEIERSLAVVVRHSGTAFLPSHVSTGPERALLENASIVEPTMRERNGRRRGGATDKVIGNRLGKPDSSPPRKRGSRIDATPGFPLSRE
ncbi:MAG: hypothetical protein HY814_15220 [Candidatus Riflebacteria bacterium]|nr:hypothetical protein [Candidatus Riflebacteria bacterium]